MPRRFPTTPQPDSSDDISYSVDFSLSHFTGTTLVVGDTVFLSDDGVEVLASTSGNYDAVNAYSFIDSDGQTIGGLYGRDDSGQNIVGFRVVDEAGNGDDCTLNMHAVSESTATSEISIGAQLDGVTNDTYIKLTKHSALSRIQLMANADAGYVRIYPRLNLLGASLEICDIYIKDSTLIFKYNDAGATRYKYLDLSGTGTTWQHSTTEP